MILLALGAYNETTNDPRIDQDRTISQVNSWAEANDAIRAVILTSTRADSTKSIDALSDWDIEIYSNDHHGLVGDDQWQSEFGSPLVQFKDQASKAGLDRYFRLVIYEDGRKVDFSIMSTEELRRMAAKRSLSAELDVGYAVILDKDGLTRDLPTPTHKAYVPSPPSTGEFVALVEELFWETHYVAKNLWRNELFPATYSFDSVMRFESLSKMLVWYIETEHDWQIAPGPHGRGLRRYLSPEIWTQVEATFTAASIEENWAALYQTIDLFRKLSRTVAERLVLEYPQTLDDGVVRLLSQIRQLNRP